MCVVTAYQKTHIHIYVVTIMRNLKSCVYLSYRYTFLQFTVEHIQMQWVFADENFLLEGCLFWVLDIGDCVAVGLMPPLLPIVKALKKASDAIPGFDISLGALTLEACVYMRTLGFEDPSCKGGVDVKPKYMQLNPVC